MISCGSRGTLIVAMFTKYTLGCSGIWPTAEERLEMLEKLDQMPHDDVTREAITAIEPCSHDVARMCMEAWDLPPRKPYFKTSAGWYLLTEEPVWSTLVSLNPSLETAMKLCHYGPRKAQQEAA